MMRPSVVLAALALLASCGGDSGGGVVHPPGTNLRLEVTGNRSPMAIAWLAPGGGNGGISSLEDIPWIEDVQAESGDGIYLRVCNSQVTADVTITAKVTWNNSVLANETKTGHGDPQLPCDPEITIDVTVP